MNSRWEDRWAFRQAQKSLGRLGEILRDTQKSSQKPESAEKTREIVKQELKRVAEAFENLLRLD
jgi:hypothetical protein